MTAPNKLLLFIIIIVIIIIIIVIVIIQGTCLVTYRNKS